MILDVVGLEIKRLIVTIHLNAVDLSKFGNGSYFFKLLDENGNTLVSDKLLKVE